MLSLIGAVLVIGATATFGLASLWRMGARVRILSALIATLETMKSEICDRMTPVPELVDKLSEEAPPPVDMFFCKLRQAMGEIGIRSFYFLWKAALLASPELELRDPEREALIALGQSLGRYDAAEQRDAFTYTQRRLESYLRHAEEERAKQGKVHAALGITVGVFVVIILL
ncbi:MAG: stage III sporulation protein AB [Oscillospiraceae bacterium]|nr:stage III sporulation protein AB [Oscillospiraceae bacterium]